MKLRTIRIRRLLPLLAVLLVGCSDFFYETAAGVPVQLALSYRLADQVEPMQASPGEAFDRADRAWIRIRGGGETLFDQVVELEASGADRQAEVELTLDEAVSLLIELDLREGETSLFNGSTQLQVTPGVGADIEIPLNPVAAGLEIANGDVTLTVIGESVQMVAHTVFATGETLGQVSPTWSASGTAVSVSESGVVTALENGESSVTAQLGSFQASVLVTVFDPCSADATALNFGQQVSGSLREGEDCLSEPGGRFIDVWAMLVDQDSPFQVTLQSSDFDAIQGFFKSSGEQITGVTTSETREYVLPARSEELYFLQASSLPNEVSPPEGDYTLSAAYVAEPQVGCIPTALVTFGSATSGNVTASDCEDEFDGEPEVVRWWDGYTILLFPGETATVTIQADFDTRFTYWRSNEFIGGSFDHSIGESVSFTVSGDDGPFHSFFVISRFHEGTGGYSIEFSGSGGGAAGAGGRLLIGGR